MDEISANFGARDASVDQVGAAHRGPQHRRVGRRGRRAAADDAAAARRLRCSEYAPDLCPKSTIWHAGAEIRQNFDHTSIATHTSRRAQGKLVKKAR